MAATRTLSSALARRSVPNDAMWTHPPAGIEAPLFGARDGCRMARPRKVRRLAHMATVADMYSAGAFATNVTDAEGSLYGDTVCRISIVGGAGDRYLTSAAVLGTPVDVTNGSIRLRYRPVANIGVNDRWSIELHSAGSPASPTANFHGSSGSGATIGNAHPFRSLTTSVAGLGRWQTLSISTAEFIAVGTGATLTAITFARLRLRSASGALLMQIDIDGIDFAPNLRTTAAAVISFDDGILLSYSAKAMAKYGFPGVLYPGAFAEKIGLGSANLTPRNLKNLHDNLGWQAAFQAVDDEALASWASISSADRSAKAAAGVNMYRSLGLTGWQDGSWHSDTSPDAVGAAYDVFEQSFRTMVTYLLATGGGTPLVHGETFPFGDPMLIRRMAVSATSERNLTHVDNAIANKGVAFFGIHGDAETAGATRTAFDALLAYLDANRSSIEVMTLDQLLAGY